MDTKTEGHLDHFQTKVMQYIQKGFKTSEIAKELSVPVHQVQYARKRILAELKAQNIANAVYLWNKLKIRITEDGAKIKYEVKDRFQ